MSIYKKKAREMAQLLDSAAKALDRAHQAMSAADGSPYSDCEHQEKAAWAEVDCALALIKEARE